MGPLAVFTFMRTLTTSSNPLQLAVESAGKETWGRIKSDPMRSSMDHACP